MASGGGDQRLAAFSEEERDSWIQVLNTSAHSFIQVIILAVLIQLLAVRGSESFSNS